jgi:hypothetical protein
VSLVSFVVENSSGGLNHEAHKGHEREDGVSVAPAGAGVTTGWQPTADAVGYRLSALRAWSRGAGVRRRLSPPAALSAATNELRSY